VRIYLAWGTGADYTTNDAQSAADMYSTILAFFAKFDSFQGRDFYLSSESYGGHYLPTLTKYILDQAPNGAAAAALNFKGFFLGNPWTEPSSNAYGRVQTPFGHGFVPRPDYDTWAVACAPGQVQGVACAAASAKILSEATWKGQNQYALSYPSCSNGAAQREALFSRGMGPPEFDSFGQSLAARTNRWTAGDAADLVYDPCVNNYAIKYLNRDDVRAAIHTNSTVTWSECSYTLDYDGKDGLKPMPPVYIDIVSYPYPLKLEVYSGDDDSNCPLLGTMAWMYGLGLEETSAWDAWLYDDALYGEQVGGFTVSWIGPTDTTLTLSTVHGAGHEVPTYKGAQAKQLFAKFLAH
jgi:hypothetical protein